MRCFIKFSYLGAPYHGWQYQPNGITVQQELEEAIEKVLRTRIPVTGAGRTDAGVHARCMYAHLDLPDDTDIARLKKALSSMTSRSIAVYDLFQVKDNAHARFDPITRTYRYYGTYTPSPFFDGLAWYSPGKLDFEAMNKAAKFLTEVDDFTSFAKLHSDARTNICHVTNAEWHLVNPAADLAPGEFYFEISANRFLRNMVRAVVGTLVEVGRGKMSLDDFKTVVETKDRCAAGTSMPAHGLYLWDVVYPESILLPDSPEKTNKFL